MAAKKAQQKKDGRESRNIGTATTEDRKETLAKHGWEDLSGGGQIEGWEAGKEVQGVVLQVKDGQFGPLVSIRDTTGAVRKFGCPSILADRLNAFSVGDGIFIGCVGTTTTKAGREAWDFVVMRCPKDKLAHQEDLPF